MPLAGLRSRLRPVSFSSRREVLLLCPEHSLPSPVSLGDPRCGSVCRETADPGRSVDRLLPFCVCASRSAGWRVVPALCCSAGGCAVAFCSLLDGRWGCFQAFAVIHDAAAIILVSPGNLGIWIENTIPTPVAVSGKHPTRGPWTLHAHPNRSLERLA